MTSSESNRIDQILTRSLKHSEDVTGLFTMHVHFPASEPMEKIKIIDDLINKLIHQYLKKLFVSDNVLPLSALVDIFREGEKVMSFDPDGSDDTQDRSFRYLSLQNDRPIWIDRTGAFIQDATEPIRHTVPIYIERNVIPQKSISEAKKYYSRIDKYLRKKALKSGFLLVREMPQVLLNVVGKELKSLLLTNSLFGAKDIEDSFHTSLRFQRYPLLVINSSKKISSKAIKEHTKPAYIVNSIDLDPNLIIREPVSTYARSEVLLHSRSCNSLLTITFGAKELEDDPIQRINSHFFEIGPYDPTDRSVLIHREDLEGELPQEDVKIRWITDRDISVIFANIDEILRSSDSILHDILLRSYRLRKLLSLAINDHLAKAVLNEVLTGENELIPDYKGLHSYFLPDEHIALLKKLFSQLVVSIQKSYSNAGISIEKFDAVVVAPFIANSALLAALPIEHRRKICTMSQVLPSSSRTLICDYLLIRELDEHRAFLTASGSSIIWIEPFFKPNYTRFRRYAIEHRLKQYNVDKHVLRANLLLSETANQERLTAKLSALKMEPSVIMVDLDLTIGEESNNDHNKFRIEFANQTYSLPGSQRILVRMQNTKWEILSVRQLCDHLPESMDRVDVDHIDVRSLADQLLAKNGTQVFDWRAKLREHVAMSSIDTVYQKLQEISGQFDCKMVSKDWFSKEWVTKQGGVSIPNQKGLLLSLGEFLSLDRHVLRTMQIQKLREKFQQAEINRGMLLLTRDILNLVEKAPLAKYYEMAKRIMVSDHLGVGYQFFKRFIAVSTDDDEVIKELIELMIGAKKNVQIKKIKRITKI
jgi:hypothetical protein